jgi:hypothetical protein
MAVDLKIVKELVESEPLTETFGEYQGQIASPEDLPMDWRIEFEERAAILEYDGGLSREEADKQALSEIEHRMRFLDGRRHD